MNTLRFLLQYSFFLSALSVSLLSRCCLPICLYIYPSSVREQLGCCHGRHKVVKIYLHSKLIVYQILFHPWPTAALVFHERTLTLKSSTPDLILVTYLPCNINFTCAFRFRLSHSVAGSDNHFAASVNTPEPKAWMKRVSQALHLAEFREVCSCANNLHRYHTKWQQCSFCTTI